MKESSAADMDTNNPYASPQGLGGAIPEVLPEGIWAFNKLVIATWGATWPPHCILSGLPSEEVVEIKVPKNQRKIGMAILLSMGVSFFLALFLFSRDPWLILLITFIPNAAAIFLIGRFAKLQVMQFRIAPRYRTKRRLYLSLSWVANILGIGVQIAGIYLGNRYFFLIGIGAIFLAIGVNLGYRWRNFLRPLVVHQQYVALRGAGKPFLQLLPTWPYGPVGQFGAR